MPIFEAGELYGAGEGAGDLIKGLASDIGRQVCGLYAQYPKGFGISNPVGNAIGQFSSGLWDSFCGQQTPPQLPPPPEPQFEGGQCPGVLYNVNVQAEARNVSDGTLIEVRESSTDVHGPIRSVFPRAAPLGTGGSAEVVVVGSQPDGVTPRERNLLGVSADLVYYTAVEVLSVTRIDGQPDTCGDPPAEPPGDFPPPVNPRTYTYDGNDGQQREINYEIVFDPTFNGPTINIPDIPNLCAGFRFDAIEIDLCTNKPGSGSGADISALEDKIDEIADIVGELKEDSEENLNKEPTEEEPPEEADPEEEPPDGALGNCVPGLRFVKVSLTELAPNANVEIGQGGIDRIDDAGWFAFEKDGFLFPPHRIEFSGAIFEPPPGVTCYKMQLRFGFSARVTHVIESTGG